MQRLFSSQNISSPQRPDKFSDAIYLNGAVSIQAIVMEQCDHSLLRVFTSMEQPISESLS